MRARGRSQTRLWPFALLNAQRIRVESLDRRRLEGVFQELAPAHFRFHAIVHETRANTYFADFEVPRDSLSRIWVRNGTHWRTGALIGAATLAVVGLGAGMAYKGDPNVTYCLEHPGGCVAGATLTGAVSGAIVGGLLGALVVRWRLVWPR